MPLNQLTPCLIGHRGYPLMAPENTIPCFEAAKSAGLKWVEFDVQPSKDLTWICLHDDDLKRTANSPGVPLDYNYQELLELDAGKWFSDKFKGTTIPTMKEVVDYCLNNNMCCNIEIKSNSLPFIDNFFIEFNKIINENSNWSKDKILISSFEPEILYALRRKSSNLNIGFLTEEITSNQLIICKDYGFSAIICDDDTIQFSQIKTAKNLNIPVGVYTCNDAIRAKKLIDEGVWAIFTDNAHLFAEEKD